MEKSQNIGTKSVFTPTKNCNISCIFVFFFVTLIYSNCLFIKFCII